MSAGTSILTLPHTVSLLLCLINCGIAADVEQKVQEIESGLDGMIFSEENLLLVHNKGVKMRISSEPSFYKDILKALRVIRLAVQKSGASWILHR